VALNKEGIQITDGISGNKIIMGKEGIQIGSSGASEPFVLGKQFAANVSSFINALNLHTHPSSGSIPATPMKLALPLSTKHKVE
jgi:hypothetical protein